MEVTIVLFPHIMDNIIILYFILELGYLAMPKAKIICNPTTKN